MLVLQRHIGQRIQIGDDITVALVRTGAAWCKLGIDAPEDVNIVRTELLGPAIRAENKPSSEV